jgi:hypothetical protein
VLRFLRRKKRCIRFVADGENENDTNSGDEGDNATTSGSVPPAADSTTELFSPMPLSAASSSNTDELPVVPGGSGSAAAAALTPRLHESNRTVPQDSSVVGRTTSCAGGPSRHGMPAGSAPTNVNVNAGLISSTIV